MSKMTPEEKAVVTETAELVLDIFEKLMQQGLDQDTLNAVVLGVLAGMDNDKFVSQLRDILHYEDCREEEQRAKDAVEDRMEDGFGFNPYDRHEA